MNTVIAAVVALLFAMAPVKDYVRPGEPVEVRLLTSQVEDAAKLVEAAGPAAVADATGLLKPAGVEEIVDQGNLPLFKVYTFEGKALEPRSVKADLSKGVVDVAAFYPQINELGTYILTWKSARPLVINTLGNPGRGKKELEKLPEAQRGEMKEMFAPVAIHLEPLSYAVIDTEKGTIKATFAYDVAPHTVDNFISLAKQKFYDGSNFHRVIKGFMIQGGDSVSNIEGRAGTGGPGHQITQEFSEKKHERGVLSMARSRDVNSAGSQFFIMHARSPQLDNQYTAFGQVIEGMDVVDKIVETPVSDNNGTVKGPKPKINSIRILPATPEMYGIKK